MIKPGIDNGNYNTKSSEGMLYASGFTASDREFLTPELQLFYEGSYYAIGERRLRFQQDKTMEQDTFILTLPAIAEAMKRVGVTDADIMLGVGLPIDSYGTQKDAFRQYFLQNASFVFEGTAYRCRISDCKVFAQGHAALCRYYPRLQEYRSITLVDIGGYTVDVLTVHNFKLERASCVSLRIGIIILYSRIQDTLQKSGILLSDALITDAIRGKIQHTDRNRIEEAVEYEVSAYCKELLNSLRERGLDLRLPTVFAGGGAELLESRLRGDGLNTVAVLNRFANADGYKLLLG